MKSLFTRSSAILALGLAAMVATTTSAHASVIGVTVTSQGQLGDGGAATDFATNSGGYNFAYTSVATSKSTLGTPGGAYGIDGYVALDAATVADSACTTACGLIALDADYSGNVAAVTLTLTGLAAGSYDLSFDVAETQQLYSLNSVVQGSCSNSSPDCDTTFEAGLTASGAGGSSVVYAPGSLGAQTASAWVNENFDFTTAGGNEVITFTPTSTISGNVPAFALLDDVTLSGPTTPTVPEPNSLMLLSTGLLGLGGFLRMRYKNGLAAKA